MKKQILGFALLFALSTNLHAQTTDTANKVITPESKTGSNSTYGNNGSNNTLDTTGVKPEMNNNNATPMTPGGTKTDSTGSKRKPPKGHMNKQKNNIPQNGGSNPQ